MKALSRRTGRRYTLRQSETQTVEVEPQENAPTLPPAPLKAPTRAPRPTLAQRSPLSVAFRHIPGNWRRYVEYVDLAARKGDPAMQKMRDCYQSLTPKDKATIWPEQLCDMAGVSPGELVGTVCREIWESKAAESSMVSSIAHPEVLMRTIGLARKADHFKDRELYFRLMGSLPDKKGASINIFNQAAGQPPALPDLGQPAKLRSFDDEIIEMSRDLETPDAPFVVRDDVSSDDHSGDD